MIETISLFVIIVCIIYVGLAPVNPDDDDRWGNGV